MISLCNSSLLHRLSSRTLGTLRSFWASRTRFTLRASRTWFTLVTLRACRASRASRASRALSTLTDRVDHLQKKTIQTILIETSPTHFLLDFLLERLHDYIHKRKIIFISNDIHWSNAIEWNWSTY